jgi:ketosteroid isomerase-like protein
MTGPSRFALATVTCVGALTACQTAPLHPDRDAEVQKLLQADRDFAALADKTGDAEAFHSYMSADGVQLPADSAPIQGPDAIRDGLKSLSPYQLRWTPRAASVSDDLTLGWTWGEWQLMGTDANAPPVSHGKYLDVWHRQSGGSWKVVADIGNSAPKK